MRPVQNNEDMRSVQKIEESCESMICSILINRHNKKTPHKREDAGYTKYPACYEKVICKPMAGSRLIYSMLEL